MQKKCINHDKPMISVIVPVYNVEEYVEKCLDSLREQSMKDIEIIVIDDGSTDKSGVIVDRFVGDDRFHIFHTSNKGLSAARNLGITKSYGDWLMFVDSDDWVTPDFCEKPYKTAIRDDADIVIFQTSTVKNVGRKKHYDRCDGS